MAKASSQPRQRPTQATPDMFYQEGKAAKANRDDVEEEEPEVLDLMEDPTDQIDEDFDVDTEEGQEDANLRLLPGNGLLLNDNEEPQQIGAS